jgi:hypothetical protein
LAASVAVDVTLAVTEALADAHDDGLAQLNVTVPIDAPGGSEWASAAMDTDIALPDALPLAGLMVTHEGPVAVQESCDISLVVRFTDCD